MRQHGRGGALLVVPAGSNDWRESIVVADPLRGRSAVLGVRRILSCSKHADPDDLKRAVDAIAGLTAVDGATIINDRYDLLAFGAKIARQARQHAGRIGQRHRTGRRQHSGPRHAGAARRHAASVGRAVRARSARRHGAGRVAGRPIHDLQVVATRTIRARASRRCAIAVNRRHSHLSGNISSGTGRSIRIGGGSKPSCCAMSSIFGRSLRSLSPKRIRNSFVVP